MTLTSLRAAAMLAACLAGTPAAFAQSAPTPPATERANGPGAAPDAGPGGPHGPERGMRGPVRGGPGLPFLRGVELSEAQQDRLFAIMHEAAPQHREHDKARRKALEALRAASGGGKFDEAKAAAAAQALGQAIAAEELLRARVDAQAMALLTPQQRASLRPDRAPPSPRPY